jgi:PKD repeat protein
MQLVFNRSTNIIGWFSLVFTLCFFPVNHSWSIEESIPQDIHIEWSFEDNQPISHLGFRLYLENDIICHTANPSARAMDCKFTAPDGTFNFYLAAYSDTGESPLSPPFAFTLEAATPLLAKITATPTTGVIPLTVSLDAGNSQGAPSTYLWSFGDGTDKVQSSQSSITHTYMHAGLFTATVTTQNAEQISSKASIHIDAVHTPIQVANTPEAIIKASGHRGSVPFSISFDGTASTGGAEKIVGYRWDFDDDYSTCTMDAGVHTYSAPGTYHPSLTVVNSSGIEHTTSMTVFTTLPTPDNERPQAAFTSSVLFNDDILTVEFDASPSKDPDGEIVNYVWDFEDSAFQSGQKIRHSFSGNSVSSFSLTVTDDSGTQHTIRSSTITFLKQNPTAAISSINALLLTEKKEK